MNLILDLLFPKKCVGCKKQGSYFCEDCKNNILQTDLVCPRCEKLAVGGQTHPICVRHLGLNGLWSLGIYQSPLKDALKQLKYGRIKGLGEDLVDILLEYWAKYQPFLFDQVKNDQGQGWVVIPVPLFWMRENNRGFNQSSVIGQILSKKLGLAYSEGLKRVRYTKPQARLLSKDRQKNIKDAFEVTKQYTLNPLPYILLIDDIWTTGATLKECCYILKKAGAKKVWALTLAR
jgi:ComF family protein